MKVQFNVPLDNALPNVSTIAYTPTVPTIDGCAYVTITAEVNSIDEAQNAWPERLTDVIVIEADSSALAEAAKLLIVDVYERNI